MGGLVVEALQRRGLSVRAMVRREDERAEALSTASAYRAACFYAPCRFPARAPEFLVVIEIVAAKA